MRPAAGESHRSRRGWVVAIGRPGPCAAYHAEMPTQYEKARAFADAHEGPGIVVLPNAWDPGTAVAMAEAGFPFVATTSAGIGFAQGQPDGQRLGRSEMVEAVGRIAAAVDVPVTADLEAGYGPSPEDVALTVGGALAAGVVG